MNSQLAIATFHQDKGAWESSIANYASTDPLDMWFNYIQWYEQNRALDPEDKFRQTLERCLSTFEYNEGYKQDLRMLKLWMKYIAMQNNPLHLYQLLYQRNIGTQLSAFYVGWAHYYDAANAYKQAESVYNLGFQAKAQPQEELQEALNKFRLSLSQRLAYEESISKKRPASSMIDQRNNTSATNTSNPPEKRQKSDGNETINQTSTPVNGGVVGGAGNGFNTVRNYDTNTTTNYTTNDDNNQCDLNNSAYVIASSLNSVYDDSDSYSQVDDNTPSVSTIGEVEGVKLYPNFERCSKNNHETWIVPLTLEEPYDPNRRIFYPKQTVYPGNGDEYSFDEIRARKWENRRQHVVYQAKIAAQRRQLEQQQKKHLELQAKQIEYQQKLDRQRQQQQQQQQQQHQQQVEQQYYQGYGQNNYPNTNYSEYNQHYYNQQGNGHQTQSTYGYQQQQTSAYTGQSHSTNNALETNQYNQTGYGNQAAFAQPIEQAGSYGHSSYNQGTVTQLQPQITQTVPPPTQQHHSPSAQYTLPIPQVHHQSPSYQVMNGNSEKIPTTYPSQTQHQSLNQQQQPNATVVSKVSDKKSTTSKSDELDDFEEQIEASTIRFYPNNNAKSKTITIKFKKEKSAKVREDGNGADVGNESYSLSTPTQKKKRSKKNHQNQTQFDGIISSGSNSVDHRYYTTLKNYKYNESNRSSNEHSIDDANLLLSIGNVQTSSNDDSSSQSKMCDQKFLVENDDSATDFQTFNGIYYGGENSNSTPVKMARFLNDPSMNKTSTPIAQQSFRYLKNKSTNLSSQNDDSMSSLTGEHNSYFAAESDDEVKQRRIDDAKQVIEKHLAKAVLDPFSGELCKAFLTKLEFPPRNTPELCHVTNVSIPTKLMQTKVTMLGNQTYHIEKEVGRGAYGAVFRAVSAYTGDVVALKVQKPPNTWELYVCNEVKKRISNQDILPGFMGISSSVLARNASVLISEFSPYGSLLDINNRIRQATTKVMHESLVMHFTSQILNIVDHLHACKIIHADIKPDNFLLMKIPTSDSHVPTIRLIDFGCAIDMSLFKERTQFKKVIQTDGFTCIEMQEGRPWSYQTDLFCVAGTVHVMLFGEYMQLVKKFGAWDIKQKLPRYLKKTVWTEIFTKLLNIKNIDHLPDLQHLKSLVDDEMYNMESELQKQIRTLSNILHKR